MSSAIWLILVKSKTYQPKWFKYCKIFDRSNKYTNAQADNTVVETRDKNLNIFSD